MPHGLYPTRPDWAGGRPGCPESESSRNDGPWQPLHGCSTSRTPAEGSSGDGLRERVPGSSTQSPRRRKSKTRSSEALREQKLWEQPRQLEQGRRKESEGQQQRQRKERWEEGRQGEARGAEAQGGLSGTSKGEERQMSGKGEADEEREEEREERSLLAPGTSEERCMKAGGPLDEMQRLPANVNDAGPGGEKPLTWNSEALAKASFSQEFHTEAEAEPWQVDLAGCSFADIGKYVLHALQSLTWERSCKTLSMETDVCYPFPLGVYPDVSPCQQPWLDAILRGLNSLYGAGQTSYDQPTKLQKTLVQGMLPFLDRMLKWPETVPQEDFSKLFMTKGVDYRGEEVKLARSFNWAMVEGALPEGVGTLKLEEFCTGGCRHYVEDFERFLLAPALQQLGKTPRVMVADDDWLAVARGLIKKGICGVLPRRLLYHVGDQVLLNGMFAVSKNETLDGVELHRLIMNLVPLNNLCKSLKGDTGTLPTVAGFSAFYLAEGEVAVLCSEDIRCFYYLFRIPPSWERFMGFAKELPAALVPPEYAGEPCHLVSLVLPMGWANSVGLAQHVHRNVVRWSMEQQGLGGEGELRRDRPATVSQTMFRVYLDNWDQVCKLDPESGSGCLR